MFRVENVKTKEIFLMQEADKGVRLYSTTDDSGNGDFTITQEEFDKDYKILEEIED